MPFQFTDYAGMPVQRNRGLSNLFSGLIEGIKSGQNIRSRGQNIQGKEIENKANDFKLQNAPEEFKLAQALKNAQLQHSNILNQQAPEEFRMQQALSGSQLRGRDIANQQAPELFKLKEALYNAKTQKNLRPDSPQFSSEEKAIQGLGRIRQQYGEDSSQFKLASALVNKGLSGAATEDGTIATKGTIGAAQNALLSIDSALPLIDKLKNMEKVGAAGGLWSPSDRDLFLGTVTNLTDTLMGGMKLSSTDNTAKMLKQLSDIGSRQSEESYNKKLDDLVEDLTRRRAQNAKLLQTGRVDLTPPKIDMDKGENKKGSQKSIGDKKYVQIKGEWFER